MTRNNVPSLGIVGGSKPYAYVPSIPTALLLHATAAPNLNTHNFPSLGGVSSSSSSSISKSSSGVNSYAATQAHACKLNARQAHGSAPPDAYPTLDT